MAQGEFSVGIVGAGPIGLATALRLADFGISSVILEARPGLLKQGSKACLIHGDALEILDKFGCADIIKDEGVSWTVARTYVRDKVIRTDVYPRSLGFGPFVNISQHRIEEVLVDAVGKEPRCDLRWAHEVTGVTQDGGGVAVRVRAPGGEQDLRFRYLVGCDGVRSALRAMVGVEWTGYTHKDCFLITDIRAKLPLDKGRHFHYDPSFNPGRQLVMHPQPDDIWRIDWQLPPDADIDAERATGDFDRRVRSVIGDIPYEIDWVSTYRFHQRVVRRLRVGRIFFAGDAAHALPPYGSRGMNSGIQDADNLAWKLALVLGGKADAELLETYHIERHAAAQENLRVTEATIRFMVPPNWLRRQARSVLLRLCSPFKSARRHVNSGKMTEPYVYTDSPIVQQAAGDPLLGSFAPDGKICQPGLPSRLRRLFGAQFVGLYFATGAADARLFVERASSRPWAVPVRLVLVLPPGSDATSLPADVLVVHDQDGALRKTYGGAALWWVVRPDGHLAASGTGESAGGFARALLGAVGGAVGGAAGGAVSGAPKSQAPAGLKEPVFS
jgi:3-(3-hydroxy-phenyl)propionate hydroxylase